MRARCLILAIFSVMTACKQGTQKYVSVNDNNGDPVMSVEKEDKDMNAAVKKGHDTYPDFVKVFRLGDTANTDFNVKCGFVYEGGREHMWMTGIHYKGDKLVGILNSEPVYIPRHKIGDSIEIHQDSVTDWMYARNNVLVGGYTIRVVRAKMNNLERLEFDKEFPFRIE